MNAKHLILALLATLLLAACGTAAPTSPASEPTAAPPPAPTATPEPADPATIALSFYKALDEGDLEAALALLADDVKFRGVPYVTGKDAVRRLLEGTMNNGARQEISDLKIEGDKVTYNWTVYNANGVLSAHGVEMVHIQDGKIILIESEAQ